MSMILLRQTAVFLSLLLLLGCTTSTPLPTQLPTAVFPTPTPTHLPPTAPLPTATPTATLLPTATALPTATPLPTPTSTPDLLFPHTLAGLQAAVHLGGAINVRRVVAATAAFTQSYIDYPSDSLTITGMMHQPAGDGPFPVVILLHGYYDRDAYWSGAGTWQTAEFLAQHGYLTIAPDFRSWGEADSGVSLFHTGLVRDVLNLISSLPSLPQADPARLGLWGHSMGGGVATKVLVVDERVKTAVLYAPNSADDADLIGRWGVGCLPGQAEAAGDKCNPADILPPDFSPDLVAAYLAAAADPQQLQRVAPLYHLDQLTAPVQIHIGLADGAALAQTPPDWSLKLHAALQAANKEATLFTYPDQGHFFAGEAWTLFLNRTLAFFDAHLQPQP